MTRIGLLGSGRLGEIIARALGDGKVPACALVGVLGRGTERSARLAGAWGGTACAGLEELLALAPDYVIEAANAQAVTEHAPAILSAGRSLICLSVGAFYDEGFYDRCACLAREHGSKVYLASGVIGGFDAASALALMGPARGTMTKYKYPRDTGRCPQGLSELPDRFEGSAREGFLLSPDHLNVAVTAALVCGSLDETRMRVEPVGPDERSGFGFAVEGEYGSARLRVEQSGAVYGPALAAWSALALLKRLVSPITF